MIKVTIDPHSGFCTGVVSAITKIETFLEHHNNDKLYCIGSIVHNSEEVQRLQKKGLVTINSDEISKIPPSSVLIRAHGEPPSTYIEIEKAKHQLIDATCKVVLNLQKKIGKTYIENPDKQIIIFGKHGHAEVIGLQGRTDNKAIVINDISEIEKNINPDREILLFSQTTMPLDKYRTIEEKLRKYCNKPVKRFNTICRHVMRRENQLKEFAKSQDVIVFISGKDSSNGQFLYKVCYDNNPKSYLISSPDEISKKWFSNDITVGVCGATSTPLWLMEKTAGWIEGLE